MSRTNLPPVLIEFDGTLLRFETDVPRAHEFIKATFRFMLAGGGGEARTGFSLMRSGDGFNLRSAETFDFRGVALEELLPLLKDEVRLQLMRTRPDPFHPSER